MPHAKPYGPDDSFMKIPHSIMDAGLDRTALFVYMQIRHVAWRVGDLYLKGLNGLVQDTGLSKSSVQRALRQLEETNAIETHQRGLRKTNTYEVLPFDGIVALPDSYTHSAPEWSPVTTPDETPEWSPTTTMSGHPRPLPREEELSKKITTTDIARDIDSSTRGERYTHSQSEESEHTGSVGVWPAARPGEEGRGPSKASRPAASPKPSDEPWITIDTDGVPVIDPELASQGDLSGLRLAVLAMSNAFGPKTAKVQLVVSLREQCSNPDRPSFQEALSIAHFLQGVMEQEAA